MNYQEKAKKLRRATDISVQNIYKIVDNFLPLEETLIYDTKDSKTFCYVPTEPNFQLPNIFLKSTNNSACANYLKSNTKHVNCTQVIEDFIEELESLLIDTQSGPHTCLSEVDRDKVSSLYNECYKN